MRIPRTLATHVACEVALYTGIGFAVATPIVLVPNAVGRFDLLLGIPFGEQLAVLGWIAVLITAYALPIAFAFGAWMALAHLAEDLELTASSAGGVGPGTLWGTVLGLGAAVAALSAFLMIEVEPRAKRELAGVGVRGAVHGRLVQAGRFAGVGPRVVFARERGPSDDFEGVMVSDDSDPARSYRAFAERGRFSVDPKSGRVTLALENGDLRVQPEPAFDAYRISFTRFEASYATAAPRRRPTDQLDLPELRDAVARLAAGEPRGELLYRHPRIYATRIQRVFALPFAPLGFAAIGVALASSGRLRGRAWALLLGMIGIGAYYASFFAAQDLALLGVWPVAVAIWSPNFLLTLVAAGLLWKGRRPG